MHINVFLLFFSFIFLQIKRERGYTKFGIRRNSPKGTYLICLIEFRGESFFFYGLYAIWLYAIFNTGLKKMASSEFFFFLSSSTRSTGVGSSARYEPCPTTNFLIIYFRWREGVPTSVLGSQPIIWLLSSFPWSGDFFRATRCHPSPILFPSGHPVQTSVFSILTWVVTLGLTYILSCFNGHSLTACYC